MVSGLDQLGKPRRRHNILVVDDDEVVLDVLKRLFSCLPHNLILTSSPLQALETIKTTEVAVLLCDMAMPQISGNEVLAKAKKAQPNVVSILLSGKADRDATIRAINDGGIWKFVLKPWDSEELLRMMEEAIDRYEKICSQEQKLEDLAKHMTAVVRKKTELSARKRGSGIKVRAAGGRVPAGRVVLQKRRTRRIRRKNQPGSSLGKRYKILELIDEGGMGTIYKARDQLLGIPVAVKVLAPSYTRKKENVRALKAEARIAMQLSHRHIVRLHNLQISRHTYFLVMEYVSGCTFRQVLLQNDRLPVNIALQVARICADALDYAHRHGVLHRDLKPENLMLTEDGVLKIIDFGLACLMGSDNSQDVVAGTPIYMSLEQIQGEPMDQRTDVYSLGAIAYELLTGTPPFPPTATAQEILRMIPPELPDIPSAVREVLTKCMAAERETRWASAGSFAQAFSQAAAELLPA